MAKKARRLVAEKFHWVSTVASASRSREYLTGEKCYSLSSESPVSGVEVACSALGSHLRRLANRRKLVCVARQYAGL